MTYTEYKNARQGEFNALPIFWAFSNRQFEEAMQERGLTMQDTDKIFSIGAGGFALKSDKDAILAFLNKEDPLPELMKDPAFAEDAIRYEMGNHEYHINWQGNWDVLSCFGDVEYTNAEDDLEQYFEQLKWEKQTRDAFFSARRKFLEDADRNGWY